MASGGGVAERYRFSAGDAEGADLRLLSDQTAADEVLQSCSTLIEMPLVKRLTRNERVPERAETLRRLIVCVLVLAHEEHTAQPSAVRASDTLAAGVLFGLIQVTPEEPFPGALEFRHRIQNAQLRQLLAARWAGSSSGGSHRTVRNWSDTYLNNFRGFMREVIENGELERCYRRTWPGTIGSGVVSVAEESTDSSAEPSKGTDAHGDQDVTEASVPPEVLLASRPPRRRHRRLILTAILGVLVVLAAVLITRELLAESSQGPIARAVVETNRDQLVLNPNLATNAGGSYITAQPIRNVPPPPGGTDSCDGRWSWAHSQALKSIDADKTIALVDLTASTHDIRIVGAQLVRDNSKTPAAAGTLLTCPGRGGNEPPDTLSADLDSGQLTFDPTGTGQPATLNLAIAKGHTEAIVILGTTLDQFCRWRLELAIYDGKSRRALTVGASGAAWGVAKDHSEIQPFETSGSINAEPYRYRNGVWTAGR